MLASLYHKGPAGSAVLSYLKVVFSCRDSSPRLAYHLEGITGLRKSSLISMKSSKAEADKRPLRCSERMGWGGVSWLWVQVPSGDKAEGRQVTRCRCEGATLLLVPSWGETKN